jgi:hypothetical protein
MIFFEKPSYCEGFLLGFTGDADAVEVEAHGTKIDEQAHFHFIGFKVINGLG